MPAFTSIAMGVMAAAALASTGMSIASSLKDVPGVGDLLNPEQAKPAETKTQAASLAAKKRQEQSASLAEGRGSTILTAQPGTQLGSLGGSGGAPKTQLGL